MFFSKKAPPAKKPVPAGQRPKPQAPGARPAAPQKPVQAGQAEGKRHVAPPPPTPEPLVNDLERNPVQGPADKLSSYAFTDLYVHESSDRPSMVRALRCARTGLVSLGGGVSSVPEVLEEDVRILWDKMNEVYAQGKLRSFQMKYGGEAYRCTLLAPPEGRPDIPGIATTPKEWVVRHVQPKAATFDDLKMAPWLRKEIAGLISQRGLVLISGPFASGKSTLATTSFDYWVSVSRDVGLALEDPPEVPLARVTMDRGVVYQFDLTDKSVTEAIRNARRMSPRYIYLGEIRDGASAIELLSMAMSGPLVICTIHASDLVNAVAALHRFASDVVSEEAARDMISSCLLQIFYQEIKNGNVMTKTGKTFGEDSHLIRSSIKNGQFRSLQEVFERQEINRNMRKT